MTKHHKISEWNIYDNEKIIISVHYYEEGFEIYKRISNDYFELIKVGKW